MILNPAARVSNPKRGLIYYKASITAQGLPEPSSLRCSTLGTRAAEHKGCNWGMQIDWWLQPRAVFGHNFRDGCGGCLETNDVSVDAQTYGASLIKPWCAADNRRCRNPAGACCITAYQRMCERASILCHLVTSSLIPNSQLAPKFLTPWPNPNIV